MTVSEQVTVRCCIAGGGPAGIMLGYLLARAGIEVLVLERHADFLRDFRGDSMHPSTLEVMHELGLLDELINGSTTSQRGSMTISSRLPTSHARRLSASSAPCCPSGTS